MPFWQRKSFIIGVFVIAALVTALHRYYTSEAKQLDRSGSGYNVYVIYANAGKHLAEGIDLYSEHPTEQFDLFLYSPTFAALFYPLSLLPDVVGLCCWNLINAVLLAAAICALPAPHRWTACMAYFVLKDLLTNLQNVQANGLMAGLMILTYVLWRRDKLAAAAFCLALSGFIKPFGLAAGIFWLIFDRRLRFVSYFALSAFALAALPLLLTTPTLLADQYVSWFDRLQVMHGRSAGDSLMGILETWFGISGVKLPVVAIGLLLQVAPLVRKSLWGDQQFQFSVLASTLIWVVIFNHEAESPTFVIASAGIVIWFFSRPITRTNLALGVVSLLLMSFGSTDIMPEYLQQNYIAPLHLKAVPGVLVWAKLQWEMWTAQASARTANELQPLLRSRPKTVADAACVG